MCSFTEEDVQKVVEALRKNKLFSIFADASAVVNKHEEQNEAKERFESAAVVELLPLLEADAHVVGVAEDLAARTAGGGGAGAREGGMKGARAGARAGERQRCVGVSRERGRAAPRQQRRR